MAYKKEIDFDLASKLVICSGETVHDSLCDTTWKDSITVEAWVDSGNCCRGLDTIQPLVSKWAYRKTFDSFDSYDAGHVDGMETKGFFGAVFDGRFVYFVPRGHPAHRHGRVLRYDTHKNFHDRESWSAYDAGSTSGLDCRGYYGAVFDGRFIYFIPRHDGKLHHTRALRYDTKKEFYDSSGWDAYDVGLPISYQGGAFDGRYIYFCPGYEQEEANGSHHSSGKILRYDTEGNFHDKASWNMYNAENICNLNTKCFDGGVSDGKYIYFVPLENAAVLRYNTHENYNDPESWEAYDASGLGMSNCVGAVFDGGYIYFVPYASKTVVRYDTRKPFEGENAWSSYTLPDQFNAKGYDGGVFDGRFVYFIPFWDGNNLSMASFHGKVVRYDTWKNFSSDDAWYMNDIGKISTAGPTTGYNAGAFDGRYLYMAPWRESENIRHGRVVRYDTTGENASFSLRYSDYGHNGGLCGALPGASFIINTDKGIFSVSADMTISPGRHCIAGVYDSECVKLYIDGELVNKRDACGMIQNNSIPVTVGSFYGGAFQFHGTVKGVRISDVARNDKWLRDNCRQI